MDIDNLVTFIKVADTRSFSRSAEELDLSQPAISKRIATLESSLSARLFDRIGNSVLLTEAGNILLPVARQINSEVNRINEMVSNAGNKLSGNLSIAATGFIAANQLGGLLSSYKSDHPQIKLELHLESTESALQGMLDYSFELAVCALPEMSINSLPKNLQAMKVWDLPLHIAVARSDPLAGMTSVSVDRLVDTDAILPTPGSVDRKLLDAELARHSLSANVCTHSNDFSIMRSLASIGLGWTILPDIELTDKVSVVHVENFSLPQSIALVRRRDRTLSRAAEAFLDRFPLH